MARKCFYIPVDQHVPGKGYVPSLVTENEAGHAPLTGQGELSEPWFWGDDYEKACEIARQENARLGLTEDDVQEIIESSVAASMRQDGARAEVERKLGRA